MARRIEDEPDERWLIKRIQATVRSGLNSEDGEVTDVRQDVFDMYMGEPLGNERDGYSQIVTREVLQAVEWALPALMRVFLGGVKAVQFRASGPQDVEQAKHETDVVNYWFFDGNVNQTGFIILYVFLKDLLLSPNAYLRVEPSEEEERDSFLVTQATAPQLDQYEADGAQVRVERETTVSDPETGEEIPVYDARITTVKMVKRVEVEALPPDSVIIDHGHHQLNLDRAKAVIVRDTDKTFSDILEMGYDVTYDELGPSEDDDAWNDEATNRLFYSDEEPETEGGDSYDLEADQPVIVHTCYMRLDWDGDGISELRRVVMAGCKILENEEWDIQTVVAGSALPVPHKHIGMGYGELVTDLQKLHTTLIRQLLDNIYGQNIQRKYINEAALLSDGSTMDALLDHTQEHILVRGDPSSAIVPEQITPIVAEIVQAIEAMKETPQLRTGVAPQLSLDPSVLEKSTMGAFVGALDQASQRLELLARLVAETVLKPTFLKIHHTLRTHFDEPQDVEIGGKWVQTDPRTWRKRSSMTCNVGLGFNNRQMMLMLLKELLMMQREALPMGLADAKKIYATLDVLIEQSNMGHVSTYFNDPNEPGFQPPPPQKDPAMVQAEANAAALQAESKRKDRELEHKIATDKEAAEQKATDAMNTFLGLKDKDALTTAQVAKIRAEITALNRDPKKQGDEAEDSADDEFARAAGLVGDTASDREADRAAKTATKKSADKPKPADKPADMPQAQA